jgi:hypothetical protein
MHGVGRPFAEQIFSVFGLPPFVSVPQQDVPDPTFPTVAFPNPEEKGALDMAKAHAELHGCDVVLANDPDADRLAVAERCRKTGEWTVFTGDQIGALLGSWLWNTIGKTSDKVNFNCGRQNFVVMIINLFWIANHTYSNLISNALTLCLRAAYCHVCIDSVLPAACGNGASGRLSL